jgi:RNase P subunit RPR2
MATIFICKQCLKEFIPDNNLYLKVYKGQSLCMMCRKANGQEIFTKEESMSLFGEESIARKS